MSRYYTNPTPVYARNWGNNGQNLVESTKIIQKQVLPSSKVHRKEKKERKKEKKHTNLKSIKQLYLPAKQVCDESEQLERSCLTEETVSHHHVGYLSDGSQNSRKRRREASPAVVESNIKEATPVIGKPLRIRFVFKKPKEPEVVVPPVPQEDPVCSTSGTDRLSEISSSVSVHEEKLLSSCPESDKTAVPSESNKKKKHKISKESRYSSLFDEPVLPCILMEEDDNNSDDWLLCARQQEKAPLAKSLMNEDVVTNMQKSVDSCFPRPQFLPEVEIFSLPYTVLF